MSSRSGHQHAPVTELITDDEVVLAARHWPSTDGLPTVVIAHGFTASKDHPEVVALADRLTAEGYGVVTFDGRGHGVSDGMCTLGDLERLDVAAAAEFARRHTTNVVVVGVSMGAIAALRYAVGDPALVGLIAVSGPATWRLHSARSALAAAATRTRLGRQLVARIQGVRLARDLVVGIPPLSLAAQVRCPAAIIHGERDTFIPASEAQLLHGQLAGPRRIELVAGMGHGFTAASHRPIVDALGWIATRERTDTAATAPA